MLRVLYDGKCGICRKEIEYYQRIAEPGLFTWHDVTSDQAILAEYDLRLSDTLMELHTIDSDNQVHKGVASFIRIWERLAYWRILAKIATLPGINNILQRLYIIFARRRFQRLDHCQVSLRNES